MQNDGSVSAVKAFFRNRWVRAILIIDVLAIIAIVGVIVWNATKNSTINFNVTPIGAKIQIDGQGEYYNGSYQIHPGTHEITISHDSLTTKTFTLDLQPGYSTTLVAFLSNNGDFDFYTLKGNYGSFQKLAEIAAASNNLTTDQDTSAYQFIADYQQAYSLWQNNLPIEYSDYGPADGGWTKLDKGVTIRTSSDDDCQLTLCINAIYIGASIDFVNQLLIDNGFNLEDYEIKYKVY